MNDGDFMARIAKGCPHMGGTGKFFQWIGDRLEQSKNTRKNLAELKWEEGREAIRHSNALVDIDQRRKQIQDLCDHVYDESPDALPDVSHDVCQICGYERHNPK